MNQCLTVTFIQECMFRSVHQRFTRVTWVRLTENKIVLHFQEDTFREYDLKHISNLEIVVTQ